MQSPGVCLPGFGHLRRLGQFLEDYGPLGVELKNNIKQAWWKRFVQRRLDMVGVDAAILMNPKVWEASGHISSFADPLVDCKACKQRFRGDKLLEDKLGVDAVAGIKLENVQPTMIKEKIACPSCGKVDWTEAKRFNLMFKRNKELSTAKDDDLFASRNSARHFHQLQNVMLTERMRLPFGIAQIGKSFRNEITPGNFIFRTREFEQMEIEYFFDPERSEWKTLFDDWKKESWSFMTETLGIKAENLRFRDHTADELALLKRDDRHRIQLSVGLGRALRRRGLSHGLRFDSTCQIQRRGFALH